MEATNQYHTCIAQLFLVLQETLVICIAEKNKIITLYVCYQACTEHSPGFIYFKNSHNNLIINSSPVP